MTQTLVALLSVLTLSTPPADLREVKKCRDHTEMRLFRSPRKPLKKKPMRLMVVGEEAPENFRLTVTDPDGNSRELKVSNHGLGPYGWVSDWVPERSGRWRAGVWRGDELVSCKKFPVYGWPSKDKEVEFDEEAPPPVWKSRWKWERDVENLYSLWVEYLFDAPPDQDVSWSTVTKAFEDRSRNLLHNHFSLGEDDTQKEGLKLKPDCADFPYILRAYFAWKNRLPFAYRPCSRQRGKRPPRCKPFFSHEQPAKVPGKVRSFEAFVRKELQRVVHSSSPRTLGADEESDFYPVELTRWSLRPGAVYADPYGHVMVIARWFPATGERAGYLFAVDAQPDGTVGRRHFWKGSFIFPDDGVVSGGGFKRFRPIKWDYRQEAWVAMSHEEISKHKEYGDFSLSQWKDGKVAFYDRMDELINPDPMAPQKAFLAAIDALEQQLSRRVESVENGEAWKRKNPDAVIEMPEGSGIFLTMGPWEDYSTPARDLRMLLALDTALDFPARVKRLPRRYIFAEGQSPEGMAKVLMDLLSKEGERRKITYRRSDGSAQTLTLNQVLARRERFEISWNPNDCVEKRWGGRDSDPEMSTCNRHAPEEQVERMATHRHWFKERRRPVR